MLKTPLKQPISIIVINRILIIIIVALAFYAGYYHAVTQSYKRSFNRLLLRYDRLEERLQDATASAQLQELTETTDELVD